jgi:hypothetical protein
MAGDDTWRMQRALAGCARVGIKNWERAAVKRAAARAAADADADGATTSLTA